MPIVFNPTSKTGDYGGYFSNTLNQQAVGLYGSTVANKFLQDAKAGRDCVDIVIAGDSNANFNNTGWIYAWEKGMIDAGALPYATSLNPSMHTAATNIYAGSGIGVTYATDQAGSPAWLTLGTASAGANAEVSLFWNNVSNEFRTWSSGLNWAHVATGAGQETTYHTQIGASSPLDTKASLKYRVCYLKFPFGNGQFSLSCYINGGAFIGSQSFSSAGVAYDPNIATFSLPADPSRTSAIRFTKYGAFYGPQYGVTGPVGFIFESVYRERKGFAVNMLQYYGGRQTGQMATTFETAGGLATIKTYLTELRNRQIAAGGTGRVLVFTNTSINDAGATVIDQYATAANRIVSVFTKAWTDLNYPQSDLAFVISRTHPTEVGDANQTLASFLGKNQVSPGSAGNVTFVDTNELLPPSFLTTNGFYDAGGNSHLTASGYGAAGNRLVDSLVRVLLGAVVLTGLYQFDGGVATTSSYPDNVNGQVASSVVYPNTINNGTANN
jgi:hypothetical protein